MSTGKNDRPEANQKKIKFASWLLDAFINAPLQIRFNFTKYSQKSQIKITLGYGFVSELLYE